MHILIHLLNFITHIIKIYYCKNLNKYINITMFNLVTMINYLDKREYAGLLVVIVVIYIYA